MKTIFAFFAITVVFCSLAFAEDTILKQVQGQGPSKDDAIKNGLFQAVAQAKGIKVGSGKYYLATRRHRRRRQDADRQNMGSMPSPSRPPARSTKQKLPAQSRHTKSSTRRSSTTAHTRLRSRYGYITVSPIKHGGCALR